MSKQFVIYDFGFLADFWYVPHWVLQKLGQAGNASMASQVPQVGLAAGWQDGQVTPAQPGRAWPAFHYFLLMLDNKWWEKAAASTHPGVLKRKNTKIYDCH